MRKIRPIVLFVLAFFVFSGCRLISPQSSTPAFPPTPQITAELPTVTPQVTETAQLLPTPTPNLSTTATSTPFTPIRGTISVDNFKLRGGPGFLFDTISLYKLEDTVTVYGKSQGGAWYFVAASDSHSGWMKADYIHLIGDAADLPIIGYPDANLISGHVRNENGNPMTGIGIVIFPGKSSGGNESDNTVTDSTGSYYLYLPKSLSGDYTIGVNAYGCDSNAVDAQCQFLYGFPSAQSIPIPQPAPISIEFVLPNL